jgi:hypothetical protein
MTNLPLSSLYVHMNYNNSCIMSVDNKTHKLKKVSIYRLVPDSVLMAQLKVLVKKTVVSTACNISRFTFEYW